MTDSARQFIDDTMAQLGEWREDLFGRYKVGRKHWTSQQAAPFIWWAYGGIAAADGENFGGDENKAIASEDQVLFVKIWGHVPDTDEQNSEEFVRVAKNDLLRALRAAGDGPNVTVGAFDWLSEDELKAGFAVGGAVLAGTVTVRLPVKADPSTLPTQFVTITGADLNIITGPAVVEHIDEELQHTIVIPPT
jgi:hypothetical protein